MKANETTKMVTIKFRKGSTADQELKFKLCDINYGDDWHKKYDPLVNHWLNTGEMCETLAQDVLYEFENMADSYDEYFENRTYRRAVDSVIEKVLEAFPDLKRWNEYLAEQYAAD